MGLQWDIIGEAGLQYFGKMSASISHELKNSLAIINEQAGLLEDFSLLAEKGRPIDPERMKSLAGKIIQQVRRADGIIKNMNRFAHSVDVPIKSVELSEFLEFVVVLSSRLASLRGVTLEPVAPQSTVEITTNPFILENLLWLCLDFAMNRTGEQKVLKLTAEKAGSGARLRIMQVRGLTKEESDAFPTEQQKALLEALKAEIAAHAESGEIIITLSPV
jgi:signal transduction histidine kinase